MNDSVFQLELYCLGKGQGNGEWVLELKRKDFPFFRDRTTNKKAERWSHAGPFHGLAGASKEAGGQGLQQEE